MRPEDYTRQPCDCPECKQAGVDQEIQYRDQYTGKWLHGYELKRLHDARKKFWEEMQAVKIKGMR